MKSTEQDSRPCPICGNHHTQLWSQSKDWEYFTSDRSNEYYHCDNCQTIFIDPMPIDRLSEIYPSNYYSFLEIKKNFTLKVKEYLDKQLFKKILSKVKGDQIKVLDVGGGSGWLLDIVRSIDPRITFTQVVDIDANAKSLAEKNGHHYFQGTVEEFETEERFDLVLMLNLIEHISDPKETLIQLEKMMNPGGLILIKTPNIESLDARVFRKSYWGGLHCPRHWILFSQKSIRHMVGETKLSVHSFKYTQGAPFWAWSLVISMYRKGWVKIGKERPAMFHPLVPLFHIIFAAFDFFRGFLGAKTSQMFIELKKEAN